MCGRFALFATVDELVAAFGLAAEPDGYRPSWNIGPGRDLFALVDDPERPGQAKAATLRWGFPAAPGAIRRAPHVNARVETAATLPAFRAAFARRRCLIPANGFFEWRREGTLRMPYFIAAENGDLFAMAGIFAPAPQGGDGTVAGACAILTRAAAGPVRSLHDRMPVTLPAASFAAWLHPGPSDPGTALGAPPLRHLLRPVSSRVNRAGEDGPELLERAPEQATLDLTGEDS